MEPFALKEKYGDKICFWGGGCDTHGAFGTGTPEEVADNVRYLMSALAPNSGFVFNQVHNVMGNVKPENIVAMLDTAYEESFKYGTLNK
jgi:Uroporphyrinogen-III decarboxylase